MPDHLRAAFSPMRLGGYLYRFIIVLDVKLAGVLSFRTKRGTFFQQSFCFDEDLSLRLR